MSSPALGQTTTWLGSPPPLSETDMDVLSSTFEYSDTFAAQFNIDPGHAIKALLSRQSELNDQLTIGRYLFYCPGLYPQALYRFFFEHKLDDPDAVLFFYFSAANLEFMDIPSAARLLLSRFALPLDEKCLRSVFDAFARAYVAANEFIHFNVSTVAQVAIACVMASIHESEPSDIMDLLSNIDITDAYKQQICKFIKANPIPIFLTFISTTEKLIFSKSGNLKKMGGTFTGKTKRFFVVDGKIMQYFKDEKKKQVLGEVDLSEVSAELIRATNKKETDHILIRRIDGSVMAGVKIGKDGTRKKKTYKKYEMFADDTQTLASWINLFNTISLWSILEKFIGIHSQASSTS